MLSRTEIDGGMRRGERRDVPALFGTLTLIPVTDAIARRAGEHLRRFRRAHAGIDLVDYLIGATAELHTADLGTLNASTSLCSKACDRRIDQMSLEWPMPRPQKRDARQPT